MTKTTHISIRIIILFSIAILLSFISDYYPSFFGDIFCPGNVDKKCISGWGDSHGPTWHWGYRHYLWMIAGLCLSIVQIVKTVNIVDNDK